MNNKTMGLKDKLQEGLPCNERGYFDSYKDNIYNNVMDLNYQNMFDMGSGCELHSKAEAVHSSSMLSYNLFHWIKDGNTFVFENVTYSKVYFEVQMRTLSCRSNPANMDVVLEGKDCNGKRHLLFIESKFTEYLTNCRFHISESYSKKDNWYNNKVKWPAIISKAEEICNRCYGEGIKQTITHLFGICGLYGDDSRALDWFNKNNEKLIIQDINDDNVEIRFVNFIYEPDEKIFPREHKRFQDYVDLYEQFIKDVSDVIVKPKIEIISYSKVWSKMKPQIKDSGLTDYIERRYMNLAQK